MNTNEIGKGEGYKHPTTLLEFESVYRQEYKQELESCDRWIKWCESQNPPDTHGVNFHQGLRGATVFNNIKMGQLLRVLKQEYPNQNDITKERDELREEAKKWKRMVYLSDNATDEEKEFLDGMIFHEIRHLRTQLEIEQSKVARCVEELEYLKDNYVDDGPDRARVNEFISSLPATPNLVTRVKELEAEAGNYRMALAVSSTRAKEQRSREKLTEGESSLCYRHWDSEVKRLEQTLNNRK